MSKKKDLFRFDVTLKDLLNLRSCALDIPRLAAVFTLLKTFWYKLSDKASEAERWNRIRVGSIEVFLDEDDHLHLDFITRFNWTNAKPYLEALDIISKSESMKDIPDELKDFDLPY